MTLNDFMFVFGLAITFLFLGFCCVIVIMGRNEEAREALKHKTSHHKPRHRKHALRSA